MTNKDLLVKLQGYVGQSFETPAGKVTVLKILYAKHIYVRVYYTVEGKYNKTKGREGLTKFVKSAGSFLDMIGHGLTDQDKSVRSLLSKRRNYFIDRGFTTDDI
jgi:hypothetical protein